MFRNVLVAVDGSMHGARALEQAIDLARSANGRLTRVAVAARPLLWPSAYQAVVTDADLEETAQALVDEAAAAVPHDVPATRLVRLGRPADEIVTIAKEGGHDLSPWVRWDAAPRGRSCSAASATAC